MTREEEEKPKSRSKKKRNSKKKKIRKGLPPIRKGQRVTSDAYVLKGLGVTPEKFVAGLFPALLILALGCCCWAQKDAQACLGGSGVEAEESEEKPSNLDEDTYGLAMAIFIKDTTAIGTGECRSSLRSTRLAATMLLVCLNMCLQVYLTLQVKRFVTPRAVEEIRDAYTEFEWFMYGADMSHMKQGPYGTIIGDPKYFDPTAFDDLDLELKDKVCHIPMAQPVFFVCILFIWALTCIGDLKRSIHWFEKLILFMPNVGSVEDVMKPLAGAGDATASPRRPSTSTEFGFGGDDFEGDSNTIVRQPSPPSPGASANTSPPPQQSSQVIGLTMRMKVFIVCVVLVPRICIVMDLLWIGCRWLAATVNFGDLIMNAVALEFLLLLKDLMYVVLVPHRTKKDLRSLDITNFNKDWGKPSFGSFTAGFLWGFAALIWAFSYCFYWQMVLPDYNWDVRPMCAAWLEGQDLAMRRPE